MKDKTYNLKLNLDEATLKDLEAMRVRGEYETYGDLIADALRLVQSLHKWGEEGFDTLVYEKSGRNSELLQLKLPDSLLIANKNLTFIDKMRKFFGEREWDRRAKEFQEKWGKKCNKK